jgi:hypothetical protein
VTYLAKPTPRKKRRGHRDPVTPEVAEFVASMDGMCVMAILDTTHTCRDRFGNVIDPAGEYELDHIYTLGMGRRGPSTSENLVRLCPWGHREKTDNARHWRPALGAWAARRRGLIVGAGSNDD